MELETLTSTCELQVTELNHDEMNRINGGLSWRPAPTSYAIAFARGLAAGFNEWSSFIERNL
jgi:hypothetical protein